MASEIWVRPVIEKVRLSDRVRLAITKSKINLYRLNHAAAVSTAGTQGHLILTAFDIVREAYPQLDGEARADAISIVRAWSVDRKSVVKYAENAWAPYKRCAAAGLEKTLDEKGISWLFRSSEVRTGAGKRGHLKAS